MENNDSAIISKDIIRFFGQFFSTEAKFFKTADGETLEIYDTPTQIFLTNKALSAVYGELAAEYESVVFKVMKENQLDNIPTKDLTLEHITQFKRLYRGYPEITQGIGNLLAETGLVSEIEALNRFFEEMVRNAIYEDRQLAIIREFRIFIAKKSVAFEGEISSDLYADLFYFLEFERFCSDNYIKERAKKTLETICTMIKD